MPHFILFLVPPVSFATCLGMFQKHPLSLHDTGALRISMNRVKLDWCQHCLLLGSPWKYDSIIFTLEDYLSQKKPSGSWLRVGEFMQSFASHRKVAWKQMRYIVVENKNVQLFHDWDLTQTDLSLSCGNAGRIQERCEETFIHPVRCCNKPTFSEFRCIVLLVICVHFGAFLGEVRLLILY